MKHSYVLLGLFSFIFLSSLLAVYSSTEETTEYAMQSLRHVNLAQAAKLESQGIVLGASNGDAVGGQIEQTARQETTALALLQENHMVVVEYTESGAVIKAVDGVGISDDQRSSPKEWYFQVNGIEQTNSSERTIVQTGDRVVWIYR
jgi:hypothetical protein